MLKSFRKIGMAGAFLLASQAAFAQTDTNFVSLFNGTDLTNWNMKRAATDITNFATVHDGYIHLESPGGAGWLWIYSDKAYTDFVLKLKFSAPSGNQGNSGVNFRSVWDPNDAGGFLNGPQVDIYTYNNWRTGCILDMTKNSQRWFFPDLPSWDIKQSNVTTPAGWTIKYFPEWNDMEIQVKGMTVKTKVNGIDFANFNGEGILNDALHKSKNVGSTGYLALQAHASEKVLIYFKDIQIADLSTPVALSAKPSLAKSNHSGKPELYSLLGNRVQIANNGNSRLKTGLYVQKSAEGARLQPVVR
jgi:Domain of Unknown Function (DUF1080)